MKPRGKSTLLQFATVVPGIELARIIFACGYIAGKPGEEVTNTYALLVVAGG